MLETYESEKHNKPEGATHYIEGTIDYLFTWVDLNSSKIYIGGGKWEHCATICYKDLKPIPNGDVSGCAFAAQFKQMLPEAVSSGLSYDMLNVIDEETLIDHIINSDISLENVIRECCKSLISTEDEAVLMPKVETFIQELS